MAQNQAAAAASEQQQQKEWAAMKERMVQTWTAAAPKYAEYVIDMHLTQGLYPRFAAHLVPLLQGRAARILDVASASGEPAATLAAALPEAHVVSTDLAAPFLELGRAHAAREGLTNMSFETADAEDLHRYPDGSFDAVTCSLGLMFMPNAGGALAEMARVLKPGGHLAVAVWGVEARVPFFHLVRQLVLEYAPELPAAASNIAGRFGRVEADLLPLLAAAGLAGGQAEELQVEMRMPADKWWQEMLEMPLPVKPALTQAAAARGEGVWEEARAALAARLTERGFLTPGGLHITGNCCWFVTAHKP